MLKSNLIQLFVSIFKPNNAIASISGGGRITRGNAGDVYAGGSRTFKHNRRAEIKASRRRRHKEGVRCAAR